MTAPVAGTASPGGFEIRIVETCRLLPPRALRGGRAEVDGARLKVNIGAWAFYIPRLAAKILHSFRGACHCIHATAPERGQLFGGKASLHDGRYSLPDWRQAYETSVAHRAAENYIAARRLHACGLGPKVIGCVAVRSLESFYSPGVSHSFGIMVENLRNYSRKRPATLEQLEAAGVVPDRTSSCLRQQIRGYVSDLNSVVGVRPLAAEVEVQRVQRQLEDALSVRALS
ncbi:MAG: hypothetical protein CMP07_05085 [Xanthomonadales bacterium]|nr:hypothetical protein [Xanthomonadales bacterium]